MILPRKTVTHFHQEKRWSCGAAALRCFLDASEEQVRKLVGTNSKGTHSYNVIEGLRKIGLGCSSVLVGQDYRKLFWLAPLSCKHPLYLSCDFVDQGKRGRPSHRHHAILIAGGYVFDPSEDRATPIDAFESVFNKACVVGSMILIDYELPSYKKNMERL